MDALERDLRQGLRGSGIVVARRGDDLLVTFLNVRLFTGESVGPAGQSLLESVGQVLRTYDRTLVQVNRMLDHSTSPLSVQQLLHVVNAEYLVKDLHAIAHEHVATIQPGVLADATFLLAHADFSAVPVWAKRCF